MSFQKARGFFPSSLFTMIILLCILSVSLCPPAHAQSTALLNGTVSDASGAAVPSAKVILRNDATSEEWDTQTNSAGLYVFPSLPPGNYRITVTQPGFQTLVATDLRLDVATSVTKDLQLTLGSVSQQIQVTTETASAQRPYSQCLCHASRRVGGTAVSGGRTLLTCESRNNPVPSAPTAIIRYAENGEISERR